MDINETLEAALGRLLVLVRKSLSDGLENHVDALEDELERGDELLDALDYWHRLEERRAA